MLLRSLKPALHSYKPLPISTIYTQSAHSFSDWHPNIPRYDVRIDKTSYHFAHPSWDLKEAENIKQTHVEPNDFRDKVAYTMVRMLRKTFDTLTGFKPNRSSERDYLIRFIFLESLAGVPGMIGGMIRHMRSLGHLHHDRGRIHYLLKEAENQRVHLFTFLDLKQPGILFRCAILACQATMIVAYAGLYTVSQKTAHRYVGYLKEQSIKNYTECIDDIASGRLPYWAKTDVPEKARKYWGLAPGSKMRDALLCMRADEALHREMNHRFADLKPDQDVEYLGNIMKDKGVRIIREEGNQ